MFVLSCYLFSEQQNVHFQSCRHTDGSHKANKGVCELEEDIYTNCLLILTMHSTKYSVNTALTLSTHSTVAHQILVNLLLKVDVGHNVAIWVLSYLSDHTSD